MSEEARKVAAMTFLIAATVATAFIGALVAVMIARMVTR